MTTSVSFELAKALKEKGFDRKCASFYDLISSNQIDGAPLGNYNLTKQSVSIPTIATVVMWLYEKHKIWIGVICDVGNDLLFTFKIYSTKIGEERCIGNGIMYESPTEAYEAAILYILNNLI